MDHGPSSHTGSDLLRWVAYERDAAAAAKLAILRAAGCESIRHFGACLREHDRHAEELAAWAGAQGRRISPRAEARFVTTEPLAIGDVDSGEALLDAMDRLETVRIDRYLARRAARGGEPASTFDGLLDRHLADAYARLARLRGLCERRHDRAA
jgi:hypothetical protein